MIDEKELVFQDVFWRKGEVCYHAWSTVSVRFDPNKDEGEIEVSDVYEYKWTADAFWTGRMLTDHEIRYIKQNSKPFCYD